MKMEFWLIIKSWCSHQCVFINMEVFCWVLVCVVYWQCIAVWGVLVCLGVCCCVLLSVAVHGYVQQSVIYRTFLCVRMYMGYRKSFSGGVELLVLLEDSEVCVGHLFFLTRELRNGRKKTRNVRKKTRILLKFYFWGLWPFCGMGMFTWTCRNSRAPLDKVFEGHHRSTRSCYKQETQLATNFET